MAAPAILIGAPATGAGKTLVTLGVIRALRRRGLAVSGFKVGPDYIDPAFHTRASGRSCLNLDSWAMRFETVVALLDELARGSDIVVGEGVMGLFDGAPDGSGSSADLAALFDLPIVLVVDCNRMGASVAALIDGFRRFREDVDIVGLVLNRVSSERHFRILRDACDARFSTPILGWLPHEPGLELPSRHLGLVQAMEHADLDALLERTADLVLRRLDLDRLLRLSRSPSVATLAASARPLPPLGQRIAVAMDAAFAFAYESVLAGWRRQGAEIGVFSPLADEPPPSGSDAVYLPGGYPELHAERLSAASHFVEGLRAAAEHGAFVYGECGGYMVLGQGLVDREGQGHRMAGLLPVETSFAEPALHLGYREMTLLQGTPLGRPSSRFRGHEFHYASEAGRAGEPLFRASDARGQDLGEVGCRRGSVAGSFLHLIDRQPSTVRSR